LDKFTDEAEEEGKIGSHSYSSFIDLACGDSPDKFCQPARPGKFSLVFFAYDFIASCL